MCACVRVCVGVFSCAHGVVRLGGVQTYREMVLCVGYVLQQVVQSWKACEGDLSKCVVLFVHVFVCEKEVGSKKMEYEKKRGGWKEGEKGGVQDSRHSFE